MREYLTSLEILALHQALLERYGGAPGIRDMGAVEAAVFRPQCGYYSDIAEEAAALLESLLINHPFVDGNKRTAFVAVELFLALNGYALTATDADCVFTMLDVATGTLPEADFAQWIRQHVQST